ncbi:transposase IS3/IS911 family protein [Gordonia sp. KTR9]|nr:transposase IS3/IS911 family protein [Gordonia sp. KTR9]
MRGIAADLGVERGTLRHWLDCYGGGFNWSSQHT